MVGRGLGEPVVRLGRPHECLGERVRRHGGQHGRLAAAVAVLPVPVECFAQVRQEVGTHHARDDAGA